VMKLDSRAPLIVAIVLLLLVTACAPKAPTGDKGEHLTLAEVKGRVQLELPEVASDIRFYQHLNPDKVVEVEFAISEKAFLEWTAQQGWKVKPINGIVIIRPRSRFGDHTSIDVHDGLHFRKDFRGVPNHFSVTFNRKTGRASYDFGSESTTHHRLVKIHQPC
jgi:hypothetical protein